MGSVYTAEIGKLILAPSSAPAIKHGLDVVIPLKYAKPANACSDDEELMEGVKLEAGDESKMLNCSDCLMATARPIWRSLNLDSGPIDWLSVMVLINNS